MDDLEKRILKEIAELDSLPVGAFNIRNNGASEARNSTANIEIESREDGQGINIHIKDGTKNESCHIPVIISHQERILEISDKIIYLKDGQVDRYDDSEVIMDELGMNERRHRRGCVVAGAEGVTCNG